MTHAELDATLSRIGWSRRGLADRLNTSESTIRSWVKIADDVQRWLRKVEQWSERCPLPPARFTPRSDACDLWPNRLNIRES